MHNHSILRLDTHTFQTYLCVTTFKNNDHCKRESKLSGGYMLSISYAVRPRSFASSVGLWRKLLQVYELAASPVVEREIRHDSTG